MTTSIATMKKAPLSGFEPALLSEHARFVVASGSRTEQCQWLFLCKLGVCSCCCPAFQPSFTIRILAGPTILGCVAMHSLLRALGGCLPTGRSLRRVCRRVRSCRSELAWIGLKVGRTLLRGARPREAYLSHTHDAPKLLKCSGQHVWPISTSCQRPYASAARDVDSSGCGCASCMS